MNPILIRNAQLPGIGIRDVLLGDARILQIAEPGTIDASTASEVIDAMQHALLPGLHDHHLHLAALAVSATSLDCSRHSSAEPLCEALSAAAMALPDQAWLRVIGYHESVAGEIDAAWIDAVVPNRPVRIQHRGGRLWILNSAALAIVARGQDDPLERVNGKPTGRLYDADRWLRSRLADAGEGGFPDLGRISRELASRGITAVTDTSAHNDVHTLAQFEIQVSDRQLLQKLHIMGNASLHRQQGRNVSVGAQKFHLLESALPDLDGVIAAVSGAHAAGRAVAFHCVTRVELAFALAAIREAGVMDGDRIEHASVCPPEMLEQIADLHLTVVTQPSLIHRRGDSYLQQVATEDQSWLYRVRGLMDAGIPLAFSSDAPYGDPNPWLSMHAAVRRETRSGQLLLPQESVSPEQAFAAWTGPLTSPGVWHTNLAEGDAADLCLLHCTWEQAAENLAAVTVKSTWIAGQRVWQSGESMPV